jgi:hypothetical protein
MIENIRDPYCLTFLGYFILCQAVLWRAIKYREFNCVIPVALISDWLLTSVLLVQIVLSIG